MRHRMFGEKACLQESGALLLSATGALPGGAKESTLRRRIPPQAPAQWTYPEIQPPLLERLGRELARE